MKYNFLAFCGFILISLAQTSAPADIVTLKDGTVIEGTVLKESRAEVVIEINISNIKSTKKIPRYKVKSIEIIPIEADEPETSGTESDESTSTISQNESQEAVDELDDDVGSQANKRTRMTRRQSIPKEDVNLVVNIPIKGQLGVEFNAKGLRAALERAQKVGANHILFEINQNTHRKSRDKVIPSGNVSYFYAAEDCLDVLDEFAPEMEYSTLVIGQCHPALSVFLASSKHILVRPKASIGTHVWYPGAAKPGQTSPVEQLDSKSTPQLMTRMKTLAQENEHQFQVFESLVIRNTQAWQLDDGTLVWYKPNSETDAAEVDPFSRYMILDAQQLVDAKFAQPYNEPLRNIGESIGVENMKLANGVGIKAIKPARAEYLNYENTYNNTIRGIMDAVSNLETYDPRNIDAKFFTIAIKPAGTGNNNSSNGLNPSENTHAIWKDHCKRSIYNCDVIIEGAQRLKAIIEVTSEQGLDHLIYPEWLDESTIDSVVDAKDWIHSNMYVIPSFMYGNDRNIEGWKIKD